MQLNAAFAAPGSLRVVFGRPLVSIRFPNMLWEFAWDAIGPLLRALPSGRIDAKVGQTFLGPSWVALAQFFLASELLVHRLEVRGHRGRAVNICGASRVVLACSLVLLISDLLLT